jgi:hypothetical protein
MGATTKTAFSSRPIPRCIRLWLERLEERLAPAAAWVPQGPGPILQGQPVGMDPQGNPDVGAVNAVAADPHNVNVLYAATASGGVWKTSDGTDSAPTWVPLTDNQQNLSVGDVGISPLDSSTLFAGTGHFTMCCGLADPGGRRVAECAPGERADCVQ